MDKGRGEKGEGETNGELHECIYTNICKLTANGN